MGGGDPLHGCSGNDVLQTLQDVFGYPNSQEYQDAKNAALNLFGIVKNTPGNWKGLFDAYEAAYTAVGISICHNWENYLQTLSQNDIYLIAQSRHVGLVLNLAMSTTIHDPTQGGHVKVSMGAGSITIDSPYSAIVVYKDVIENRKRNRKP
jgi:hypothetical protein